MDFSIAPSDNYSLIKFDSRAGYPLSLYTGSSDYSDKSKSVWNSTYISKSFTLPRNILKVGKWRLRVNHGYQTGYIEDVYLNFYVGSDCGNGLTEAG